MILLSWNLTKLLLSCESKLLYAYLRNNLLLDVRCVGTIISFINYMIFKLIFIDARQKKFEY